jgi:hypothetical protein
MKNNPEEITLAKLEVVVMPNGEIICSGKTVGWVKDIGKYLSDLKNGITGEPIK